MATKPQKQKSAETVRENLREQIAEEDIDSGYVAVHIDGEFDSTVFEADDLERADALIRDADTCLAVVTKGQQYGDGQFAPDADDGAFERLFEAAWDDVMARDESIEDEHDDGSDRDHDDYTARELAVKAAGTALQHRRTPNPLAALLGGGAPPM